MNFRKSFSLMLITLLLLSTGCSKVKDEIPSESNASLSRPSISISSENSSESPSEISSESAPESSPESSFESSSLSSSEISSETSSETSFEEGGKKYSQLILVNPNNYIPDDYMVELETVQGKYKMDIKAAESAKALLSAAKSAGFDMALCSAYRTVEKSRELYNRKVNEFLSAGYSEDIAKKEAAKWVAPPGTSEHHTGLAMDLVSSDYWGYYSDLEHAYENFDSFKWMYEHCAEYGFILRYPKDKQDITGITYEPWHYRYVGKDAAKYIMENGLCLEEYLEIIK